MTTAEFIKMLQEADPAGTAHIRMPDGGIPVAAEHKPGYWDGPYNMFDSDGNWVQTSSGSKVDIHTREVYDWVWDMVGTYRTPTWEEIASKFKFDYVTLNQEANDSRANAILKEAREAYEASLASAKRFREDGIKRALENESLGWRCHQNNEVNNPDSSADMHHYYTWQVFDEKGRRQPSNLHNVEAIYRSGLFRHIPSEIPGHREWILSNK